MENTNLNLFDGDVLTEAEVEELFGDFPKETDSKDEKPEESKKTQSNEQQPSEGGATEENIDIDNLFGDEEDPESVGSKDKQGNKEGAASDKSDSPYVFASLAKALKEEGIFLDLDDEDIKKISKAEDFSQLVEKTIQARFDDRQKRVDEALNNGVSPSVVQQYENILHNLESITDSQLEAESAEGENLRKQIIYRDYLNKGFSKERAEREVNKSVADGNDVDDAREALESIKQGVKAEYQRKLDEAKAEADKLKQATVEQAATLRKSILEDKKAFGEVEVDKATRQKALDAIIKPVYQDPETGEKYTAIQKYEKENRAEFLKNVGLMYVLTDGFKNIDRLVKDKVKKEVGKGMKELEDVINNTQRNDDGSLRFTSGVDDKDSMLNFTLDV